MVKLISLATCICMRHYVLRGWSSAHNQLCNTPRVTYSGVYIIYGLRHETVAVLLPGFAINWKWNQVTRQPQFRDLTHLCIFINTYIYIHDKSSNRVERSLTLDAWMYTSTCNCSVGGTPVQFTWPWWRHQMEIFSALLALCVRNSPVTGEFPAQRPVTRSFDVVISASA